MISKSKRNLENLKREKNTRVVEGGVEDEVTVLTQPPSGRVQMCGGLELFV